MENDASEKQQRGLKGWLAPIWVSKKSKAFFLISLVSVIIVLGVTVATVTGFLAIRLKTPSQKVVVFPGICGSSVVESYNKAAFSLYPDEYDKSVEALQGIVTDIQKKAGYEKDSSCVFISFQAAYLAKDYSKAKAMEERFKELVENNQPADGRIAGLVSLNELESMLNQIKPATSTAENSNE